MQRVVIAALASWEAADQQGSLLLRLIGLLSRDTENSLPKKSKTTPYLSIMHATGQRVISFHDFSIEKSHNLKDSHHVFARFEEDTRRFLPYVAFHWGDDSTCLVYDGNLDTDPLCIDA